MLPLLPLPDSSAGKYADRLRMYPRITEPIVHLSDKGIMAQPVWIPAMGMMFLGGQPEMFHCSRCQGRVCAHFDPANLARYETANVNSREAVEEEGIPPRLRGGLMR